MSDAAPHLHQLRLQSVQPVLLRYQLPPRPPVLGLRADGSLLLPLAGHDVPADEKSNLF